jgi:hypothetical protein
MTDNPVELAEEAVALRLIGDALLAKSKNLAARAAAVMGRGTLFPTLPDGTELACFNVPADAETVTVDVDLLLPFVKQHYPTEVMETVRPAFVERVKETTRKAKAPCAPDGELDVPGVEYSMEPAKGPRITAKPAGKDRAAAAVEQVLAEALTSFARPALIEETS